MGLNPNSLANAVGASVRNTQFQSAAEVLQRRIGVIATYDPALTSVVAEVPVLVLSPEDAGDKFGFGFMAHRLVREVFKGAQGVPTYVIPQAQVAGSAADGDIDFTAGVVVSGSVALYIAGDRVAVPVPAEISGVATTAANIATLIVAAVSADNSLPVTAAVNGVTASQVDFTSKTIGTYGNEISLALNLNPGEELPGTVSAVITPMASGAGTPDIGDALDNGLGTGDNANDLGITDLVHGYLQGVATLNALSVYVGEGNQFAGLYAKTVARPFRSLTGDTAAGSAGLSSLIAISNTRLLDRTNGVVSVPGSQSHPSEIAAQAIGHMSRINSTRAEEHYTDTLLSGIWPGNNSDRWTADFDSRDIAVKSGISPTLVKSGAVVLQNVVSFYRPASVPVSSNGYRSMRNISITQNVLNTVKLNFEQEKWKGISIVSDVNRVGNASSKDKARDTSSVIDDLVSLALGFQNRAWIFDADFTIAALQDSSAITIRAGGAGFDSNIKLIYSGEGGILDTVVEFDTSIAAALN